MKIRRSTFELSVFFLMTFILYVLKIELLGNFMFFLTLILLLYFGKKKPELLLITLVVIETKLFGVGPTKIFGVLMEKIEILVLLVSYIYWAKKRFINKLEIPRSYNLLWTTGIIIVSAAVMGKVTSGQSFVIGILFQTRLFILFSLFPILALMKEKKNSFKNLKKLIKICALIHAILNAIQFIVYPRIQFLTITSENIRFGAIRITHGYVLITIALMITFSEILYKISLKNMIYLVIYFVELLLVCKTRMVIFGVVISMIFAVLSNLRYKSGWKKMAVLGGCGIIMICVLYTHLNDMINLTQEEVSSNSGNYVARTDEIAFYTAQVKNPIVGRGFISPKSANGEAYDTKYGYFSLTDIGVVGLYVTNGVIGIIWFVLIIWIIGKQIRRNKKYLFGLEYFVYSIVVCMTLLTFYYNSEYLIITLILLADNNIINEQKGIRSINYEKRVIPDPNS